MNFPMCIGCVKCSRNICYLRPEYCYRGAGSWTEGAPRSITGSERLDASPRRKKLEHVAELQSIGGLEVRTAVAARELRRWGRSSRGIAGEKALVQISGSPASRQLVQIAGSPTSSSSCRSRDGAPGRGLRGAREERGAAPAGKSW
jgi:hypothetical protein